MGIAWGQLVVGPLQVNCYIAGCEETREAVVIDPGDQAPDILAALDQDGWTVVKILGTHAHWDHVLAVRELKDSTGAPYLLHPADRPILEQMQARARAMLGVELPPPPEVDAPLEEGRTVRFGSIGLRVLHTPGHSPGSVSFYDGGQVVVCGDALFAGSIGRTDLDGGDHEALLRSIREKLLSLPDAVQVLPGHGPPTTIGRERASNPFLTA